MPYRLLDLKKIDLANDVSSSFMQDEDGNWVLLPLDSNETNPHLHADFNRKVLLFNGVEPFPYKDFTADKYAELSSIEQQKNVVSTILEARGFNNKYELLKKNYYQGLIQISNRVILKKFDNINNNNDLVIAPKNTSANFYQVDNEVHLDIVNNNFIIELPTCGRIILDVKMTFNFILTDHGTVLQSIQCESDNEEELNAIETFMSGNVTEAQPFYKEAEKKVILSIIKSNNNLNEAKEYLKQYLDLSDPNDSRIKAAKNVLLDINQVKPAPAEHDKYIKIIKTTASLAAGETKKIGSYMRQAKQVHDNQLLKKSMLMLAGIAMIGLSVGLAILSHGASTPVSIAGIHMGITLITALVHAKAALGFVATVSSVGWFGKSMNKSTNFLQENMDSLAKSARAAPAA